MSHKEFQEEEYSKPFDFRLWRKVISCLTPYRKNLIWLILVMISTGGVDAILPLFTLYAIDNYVTPCKVESLPIFAGVYFIIVMLQAVNVWFLISIAGNIEWCLAYDIRRKGFHKLQELSFSYFDRTPVGWLMARMTSDCERLVNMVSWGIVDIIWGFTMMIGISVIMIFLNWKLALIVLSVIPILIWVSGKFQCLILRSYREIRKVNSRITGAFNEGIMGVNTTKTLARERENLGEFKELTYKMRHSSVKAAIASALYLPIVLLIGTIGCGIALWFGGKGVIAGVITYGTLVAFIAYTLKLFEPIQQLARIFAELQNAQASAERIFSMIETEPEIKDNKDCIASVNTKIKGDVEFINVGFHYKNGKKVLESFNLKVNAGETIALVGQSGGGKSTIVNLACRFYQPTSGKILVDGINYDKYSLQGFQSNLGVVLQKPHLFSGSIKENIRYGSLDASDDEVKRAAKLVKAHEFIMGFENGYDTYIGAGGSLLSTGQKQLLSFARAILADPSIFIMDEATSSVDTQTEHLIQYALEKILKNRTSFIIAHRLSTVKSADRILVVVNGEIIEEGNHSKLIKQMGYYYKLYTNQYINQSSLTLI
ncbi:MAG: ABC transporter ATP-binding protein [Candidatus Komeilibacteria bacterium]